jgi:predicted O-methyltransferase YrrM
MEFIDEQLSAYAEKHTTAEPELLQKLNRDTYANVLIPRMLSGHLQGRILSMFSHMIQPKRILEIGTYTGYSALCLAEGLTPDGKLITIDINEELEDRVRRYINDSDYSSQIDFRVGNALEIIPTLEDELDLVFIDADKPNYSNYFDLVIDKLRTGGIIIADNVLWSAKVLDPEQLANDEDTKALHEFNEKMQQDSRVENVLMPVRDGLMVVRKK